jgi:hypothetical protein
MSPPDRSARARLLAEGALLLAIGALMGVLGPYDSARMPAQLRFGYWLACIVGGGVIGITLDTLLARRVARPWRRVLVASLAMTPPVMLWVFATGRTLIGDTFRIDEWALFGWQVFAISLAVMAVRALVQRRPQVQVETRTVVEPPLPEAEAAFRRRLSAHRRYARLLALEADDHYVRVHTDAGEELLTLRFADAIAELARAHGLRLHRSWWVAGDAIETVSWRRGGAGEARLAGGLVVPVSRGEAAAVRAAGW